VTSISAEVAADHVDVDEDHAPHRKLRPGPVADLALPRRERRGEPSGKAVAATAPGTPGDDLRPQLEIESCSLPGVGQSVARGGTAMTTVLLTASTSGSVIDAQRLVVFTWRPEPGATTLNYTQDGGSGLSVSDARGHVAFLGATMHEPFTARPARIEFSFTNHASATNYTLRDAGSWSWTPETGVLDPNGASGTGPSWISTQMRFTATEAQAERAAYSTDPFSGVIEHGRWVPLETAPQLRMWGSAGPDLLAGGAGDDTLVGGEMGGVPRLGGGDTLRGGRATTARRARRATT
jgi:hypothetical protein